MPYKEILTFPPFWEKLLVDFRKIWYTGAVWDTLMNENRFVLVIVEMTVKNRYFVFLEIQIPKSAHRCSLRH